ncbi:MAG: hypothetical protein V4498_05980 [candidate division FCPU426 bacterium]
MDREIFVPPSGPPQGPGPDRDLYAQLGEEAIFRICRDFYSELERSSIRAMFPENMDEASKKLAMFLVPLMGGPPLYQMKHGPPRMRARHIPFVISEAERGIWLACFDKVLARAPEAYGFPKEKIPGFRAFLEGFSAWMVNKA